MRKLTNSC